ncbi:MAG: hypothetical protein OXB89_06660 [Anaerolineaceae bacterium]|nr:hypothetical protein [Anaerolineaceae bacterium]
MMRRSVILLTTLLWLAGVVVVRAQSVIEGIDGADLALLTKSIVAADTLHFDVTLRIDGDPALTGGLALDGPGAVGRDDRGHALIMLEAEGLFNPGGRYEEAVFGWMRLVDDSLYLRVADDDHWRVMPAREIEAFFAASGLPGALGEVIGVQAHDFPAWLEALGLDAFASGTRLEDADGQARFRIDVDAGAWLNSPTFNNLMMMAGEASVDEFIVTSGMMLAMALEGTRLTIESAIDPGSGLMRQLVLTLEIELDTIPVPGSGDSEEWAEGSLLLILDNLRYDNPLTVNAPAEEDTRPA